MRQPGRVYVRQTGTSGEWVDVGSAAGFSVALEVNEPINAPKLPTRAGFRGGFKFTRAVDPELVKLYYGTDVVNNRGGTRKEEKHMWEFTSTHGGADLRINSDQVDRTAGSAGVYMRMIGDQFGWFKKADVPLIAHALFEKSGWPGAVQDGGDAYKVTIDGEPGVSWTVESAATANKALAEAIANLAAYNAWVEGAAEREAAEAAKKRERDGLRTSAIALEALELYNEVCDTSHASWDATEGGTGLPDANVRHWIAKAEAARAAKPVPKVGDRVRVSADAKTVKGGCVYFVGEVEGVVVANESFSYPKDVCVESDCQKQYVDPKYVTILATAEDLAAEKAKAERDAGIVDLTCVMGISRRDAEVYYNRGIRATA